MSLVAMIVVIVVVGLLLYVANNYLPLDPKIKQILNVVVVIALVLWLLFAFFPGIENVRVPTAR